MHLSENEGVEDNTFVVTGGLGFVGSALCLSWSVEELAKSEPLISDSLLLGLMISRIMGSDSFKVFPFLFSLFTTLTISFFPSKSLSFVWKKYVLTNSSSS